MNKKPDDITRFELHKMSKGFLFKILEDKNLQREKLKTPCIRDFHAIIWVKKGAVKYQTDFKKFEASEDSLLFVAKDSLHYFTYISEDCELQSIVFTPSFIYRKNNDLSHLARFNAQEHKLGIHNIKLSNADKAFFKIISQQLIDINNREDTTSKSENQYHLLCVFLIRCGELQNKANVAQSFDKKDILIRDFTELLEQHFKQNAKVEFYTNELNISAKQLYRLVKAQFNVSVKEKIDQRRILEIKRLLVGSTQSVKEIAIDFGFNEVGNMVKYFKNLTGDTPKAFRDMSK